MIRQEKGIILFGKELMVMQTVNIFIKFLKGNEMTFPDKQVLIIKISFSDKTY